MAVRVNGLVKKQRTFRSPTERVNKVVRVGYTEARQHAAFFIGFPIAVGIHEVQNFGRIGHIHAAITWKYPRGRQQSLGKNRRLIRFAIAVGIFQHIEFIVGLFARFDVGVGRAAHHPQPSVGIPAHLHGIDHHRLGSKKRHFKTILYLERGQFLVGIRARSKAAVVLMNRSREEQHDRKYSEFENQLYGSVKLHNLLLFRFLIL